MYMPIYAHTYMQAPYIKTMATFLPAIFVTRQLIQMLTQYNTENASLIYTNFLPTDFLLQYATSNGQAEAHTFTVTPHFPPACGWHL